MKARLAPIRNMTTGRVWLWTARVGAHVEILPGRYDSQARHEFARQFTTLLDAGAPVRSASGIAHIYARHSMRLRRARL